MIKWILIVLLFLGMLATILYQMLVIMDARAIGDHVEARGAFFRDAALQSCVNRETLTNLAEEREWRVDQSPELFRDEGDTWDSALWINISPPLPFAKLHGTAFYFDGDGCLIAQ